MDVLVYLDQRSVFLQIYELFCTHELSGTEQTVHAKVMFHILVLMDVLAQESGHSWLVGMR